MSAGRPIIQMSAELQAAWRLDLNRNIPANKVGRRSELQAFFWLVCRIHLTYKSPKAITERELEEPGAALTCRQCSYHRGEELPQPVSRHEVHAWQILTAHFSADILYVLVEVRVLGGNWGAADIWLPWSASGTRLDLIIMIDGEKHFSKGWGEVTVPKQKRIDHRFNAECWRQDHRLLRLYSDDKDEWPGLIATALQKAVHEPSKRFQLFSAEFADRTEEVDKDADMSFSHRRNAGMYFEGC